MYLVYRISVHLAIAALIIAACGDDQKKPTCADGLLNQNEADVDCGGPCPECARPADGVWVSYPVSFLMVAFADSIVADFKDNGDYSMVFWQNGTPSTYSGTCVRTPSGVADLFAIQIEQTVPTASKHSGIFQLLDAGKRMALEIVQTQPSIGATPPEATQGLGSTKFNGLSLGNKNIQEFRKR